MINSKFNNTGRTLKKTILIIDDEIYIRKSTRSFLEDYGFAVIEAEDGQVGLERCKKDKPDLVLCDLRMPKMDGLEVLEAVTQSQPEMPIIIVSGAGNIADTVKALRLGAWDYIIKPIQNMDVLNYAINKAFERVDFIEAKHRYQANLEKANTELSISIDTLNQTQDKLVQSEKMAALGELVAGIAHEINTPIGIGVTAASFLDKKTKEFENIYKSGDLKKSELEAHLKIIKDISETILVNMEKAGELITSFKQIAVDQSIEKPRLFNLNNYIEGVLLSLKPKFNDTDHTIKISCSKDIEIMSFPGAFYQIVSNLILNSLFHGFKNMDKGRIDMLFNLEEKIINFTYKDNGAGMTSEQCMKIFDPFYTTMRGQGGTGIGMSIVFNLITQTLKGSIECESSEEKGTVFEIKIPVPSSSDN